MIRIFIIFLLLQGFQIDLKPQSDFQNRHIYGVFQDFYYLDIRDNAQYSLKVGMYNNKLIKGKYKIKGDTLELMSFNFNDKQCDLPENKKLKIKSRFSKFFINDSLLIPIAYQDLIPFSTSMERDSTIIREYLQNDGHVYFKITFRADSTFLYETGSDKDRYMTKGTWKQSNNIIQLYPEDSDNLLNWICTDYKLQLFENFLIGKIYNDKDNTTEYQYLIELKTSCQRNYIRQPWHSQHIEGFVLPSPMRSN